MLAIAAAALCLTGLTGTTRASAATAAPGPASTLFAWAPSPLPVAPAPVDLPGGTRLTAIAASRSHSLALTSGGRVLAWGVNSDGDLGGNSPSSPALPVAVDVPAGIRVAAVAAGEDFSLALASGGRVLAWGGDNYGELGNGIVTDPEANPPSPTPMPVHLPARTRVTAIAAAGEFALALTSRGRVLAWGDNRDGELGDGSAANSATPVPVHLPARTRVTAIAAGYDYGLALTAGGRVLAWGYNSEDELGDNSACNSSTPVPVDLPAGTRVTAIFAAFTHSFALTSDGRLLGWGFNQAGQVGDGTSDNNHGRPIQVRLPPGTHVAAVGGGYFFSIALTSNGRVLAWGGNTSGVGIIPPTLVNLPPGTRVTAIAAGYGSSLALAVRTATVSTSAPRPGGPVFASGLDNFGQLGEGGAAGSSVPVPAGLPPGTDVTAVAAADDQSLALTAGGQFLAWGSGDNLSRTAGPTPVPVSLPAGTRVTAVAASADHTLALTADGRIFDYGQTGCGDDVCPTNQVTLPAGIQVTAIAAGDAFSLALTSDGRVLAWGSNAFGLQGDDNTSQQFGPQWVDLPAGAGVTAIAGGGDHWLALTSDGRVLAWGDNESGDLGNGTTVSTSNEFGAPTPAQVALPAGTQVTAIAAGTEDSQAMTSDGRVLAWGYNGFGQLGDGSTASSSVPVPVDLPAGARATAIAAGDNHNLAVTSDGRVLAWGYNAWGQLGDGSTGDSSVPVPMELPAGTRATAVAAGQDHSLALTAQAPASHPRP